MNGSMRFSPKRWRREFKCLTSPDSTARVETGTARDASAKTGISIEVCRGTTAPMPGV